MITGFRWHLGGAQKLYGVAPDLSAFGKALGNGFAVSALVGKREFMERGGLRHADERVFLLSTTHGAETHGLAAAIETMKIYEREGVVDVLHRQGARLRAGIEDAAAPRVSTAGFRCSAAIATSCTRASGADGKPFAALRRPDCPGNPQAEASSITSAGGELRARKRALNRTIDAVGEALAVYRRALDGGIEKFLESRPVQPVFRPRN